MIHASERTNYPVSMGIDDTGSGFILRALAPPSAGPDRVCQYLQQAITGLVDLLEQSPETPLEKLVVLTPSERDTILNQWSGSDLPFPQATLDALFAAQVSVSPSAIAVVGTDGKEFTYAEVEERSTHLARHLVASGIGFEDVVGVRMDARPKRPSRSWASSKQALCICRSTRPIRLNAFRTWLRTPAPC